MAKQTTCAFCSKEITKGIFNGNSESIDLATISGITCCEECYKKYKSAAKEEKERFNNKFENMKKATKKKYNQKEIADMFIKYLNEKKEQKEKTGNVEVTYFENFYCFNSNGYFTVQENSNSFMGQDIDTNDMNVSIYKSQFSDTYAFTKDDITKIEYAFIGTGDFNGLFKKAYSVAIRLNDESVMTYKPVMTRTAVAGWGFGIGYKRSAEKKVIKELEAFKKAIGSNLPITKGKRIGSFLF